MHPQLHRCGITRPTLYVAPFPRLGAAPAVHSQPGCQALRLPGFMSSRFGHPGTRSSSCAISYALGICPRKGSKRFRPPSGRSGMVAPLIQRVHGDSFWQFLQPQSRSSISVLLWVTDPLDLSSCVKHAGPADTAQGTQHLLLPAQRAHSPVQPSVCVRPSIQMAPRVHGRQALES